MRCRVERGLEMDLGLPWIRTLLSIRLSSLAAVVIAPQLEEPLRRP